MKTADYRYILACAARPYHGNDGILYQARGLASKSVLLALPLRGQYTSLEPYRDPRQHGGSSYAEVPRHYCPGSCGFHTTGQHISAVVQHADHHSSGQDKGLQHHTAIEHPVQDPPFSALVKNIHGVRLASGRPCMRHACNLEEIRRSGLLCCLAAKRDQILHDFKWKRYFAPSSGHESEFSHIAHKHRLQRVSAVRT